MAIMEPGPQRSYRGARANGQVGGGGPARRAHPNKRWVAGATGQTSPNEPETAEEREKFWQEVRRKYGLLSLRSPCPHSL